jgi:predicted enzyme related to lactoylglutathione lyase
MAEPSVLARSLAGAVLRAVDLERARRFYGETLGLEVEEMRTGGDEIRVIAGGESVICIYRRPQMPAPHNTVACFEVTDLKAVVAELRGRGVVFEEYDIPEVGLKTVDGIADLDGERRAWFKDSEDNILVIRQA